MITKTVRFPSIVSAPQMIRFTDHILNRLWIRTHFQKLVQFYSSKHLLSTYKVQIKECNNFIN